MEDDEFIRIPASQLGDNLVIAEELGRLMLMPMVAEIDSTSALIDIGQFCMLAKRWADNFLQPTPCADRRIQKFAVQLYLRLWELNYHHGVTTMARMRTRSRVSVSEMLHKAIATTSCVALEYELVTRYIDYSPMHPSLKKYPMLQPHSIPIMRCCQMDFFMCVLFLITHWKDLDYDRALVKYVEILNARAMMLCAHPWSEKVMNYNIYSERTFAYDEQLTDDMLQARIQEKQKAKELERRNAALMDGVLEYTADDLKRSTGKQSVSVKKHVDPNTGELRLEEKREGQSSIAGFRTDPRIAQAQELRKEAQRTKDPDLMKLADDLWTEVEKMQVHASSKFERERAEYYAEMRAKGQNLEVRTSNKFFNAEMHAIFLELMTDIKEVEDFPARNYITLKGTADLRRMFKVEQAEIDNAYRSLKSQIEHYINECSSAKSGNMKVPYFEHFVRPGERQRHLMMMPNGSEDPWTVIWRARTRDFRKLAIPAMEPLHVIYKAKDTPLEVRQWCVMEALDFAFRESLSGAFIDNFYFKAQDSAFPKDITYPVYVKACNRMRGYDNGMLVFYDDIILWTLYWLYRIVKSRRLGGMVETYDIVRWCEDLFPNDMNPLKREAKKTSAKDTVDVERDNENYIKGIFQNAAGTDIGKKAAMRTFEILSGNTEVGGWRKRGAGRKEPKKKRKKRRRKEPHKELIPAYIRCNYSG